MSKFAKFNDINSFTPYKRLNYNDNKTFEFEHIPYLGNYYIPRPRGYVVPFQYQIGNPLPELNSELYKTGMWNPRTNYKTE
jgi:hypothetical protein